MIDVRMGTTSGVERRRVKERHVVSVVNRRGRMAGVN